MKSPFGALLVMGAMLGASCPPMGRLPVWPQPANKRADPNKKRRRKARQAAQRRNR